MSQRTNRRTKHQQGDTRLQRDREHTNTPVHDEVYQELPILFRILVQALAERLQLVQLLAHVLVMGHVRGHDR